LLFVHAYRMSLEGIVSKTAERALPVGAISRLAQCEKPGQLGDGPGPGSRLVTPDGAVRAR
jgi:hypothetical protein